MKKSWKKLVCGLLCAALLWGSLPLQASAAWFSDVPWTAWYRRAVNELADMGNPCWKAGTFPSTSSEAALKM